jgi:hypothetical protein
LNFQEETQVSGSRVEEQSSEEGGMAKTVPIIGIETAELRWIRMLVALLRHPDPSIPELARQALLYLTTAAAKPQPACVEPKDHAG